MEQKEWHGPGVAVAGTGEGHSLWYFSPIMVCESFVPWGTCMVFSSENEA